MVILENMEFPQSCYECHFAQEYYGEHKEYKYRCVATFNKLIKESEMFDRQDFCPLKGQ